MKTPPVTSDQQPRYPGDHIFVVQFQAGSDEPSCGRIQHVASGRERRFQSNAQLLDFVSVVLSTLLTPEAPVARNDPGREGETEKRADRSGGPED